MYVESISRGLPNSKLVSYKEVTKSTDAENVAFMGTYVNGAGLNSTDRPAAVKVTQTNALKTRNITFNNCQFLGVPIGVYSRTSKHDGPCKVVETEPNSGLSSKSLISPFSLAVISSESARSMLCITIANS